MPEHPSAASVLHERVRQLRRLQLEGRAVTASHLGPFLKDQESDDRDDELATFIRLTDSYPFDPPLDDDEKVALAVDAVVDCGFSYGARALSLAAGGSTSAYQPAALIKHLAARRLNSSSQVDQASWLIDYLLDEPSARKEVIEALRAWPARDDLAAVLHAEADRLPSDLRPEA